METNIDIYRQIIKKKCCIKKNLLVDVEWGVERVRRERQINIKREFEREK